MDHPTHKTDAYKDTDHKWIAFCRVCSREGGFLAEPCSGKYELTTFKPSNIEKSDIVGIDTKKEQD